MLLACAAVIYLACEWFVNAVEWLGVELKVGAVAVGTILAAVGTALPESVVTLVAVLFGSRQQGDGIAVGAAMGGPLVVGTIAYGVAGSVLIWRRQRAETSAALVGSAAVGVPDGAPAPDLTGVDTRRLAKDQAWFLVIYAGKVALGLVAFAIKPWLGLCFFAAYGVYFWRELRAEGSHASDEDLGPLRLQPRRVRPARWAVLSQTVATLVLIFLASQLFVRQLEWAGPALGLSPVVVPLLLAPIATELPEILNAVIWARQGKTQLALANISGSMMIQATVPSGIGVLFTSWRFDAPLILAAAMTASAISYLLWLLKADKLTAGRLAGAFGFYAAFAVGLVLT
jgi:cation:H+ antiporter